jgi:hypothetical protein
MNLAVSKTERVNLFTASDADDGVAVIHDFKQSSAWHQHPPP